MKNITLNEELLNQIRLIKYDRSKTLLEQNKTTITKDGKTYEWQKSNSDNIKNNYSPTYTVTDGSPVLGADPMSSVEVKQYKSAKKLYDYKIKKNCRTFLSNLKTPQDKIVKNVFDVIKYNIDVNGTEEDDLLNAIKQINSKEIYIKVMLSLYTCFNLPPGVTLIQFLQSYEFSEGSKNSATLRYFLPSYMIQYKYNDYYLIQIQKILQKFNPDEKYSEENPFKGFKNKPIISTAKMFFPPYVREVLHLTLPLASLALMFVPGGQGVGTYLLTLTRGIGIGLELFDASIYLLADEDPYMAGLTVAFAFCSIIDAAWAIKAAKNANSILLKTAENLKLAKIYGPNNPYLKTYTKEEIEVLVDMATNSKRYLRSAKMGMFKSSLDQATNIYFKNLTMDGLVSLARMYKSLEGVFKIGGTFSLYIGGAAFTWDYIASLLGMKCKKTFNISDYAELIDERLKKPLDYLQPFTQTKEKCLEQELMEDFENYLKSVKNMYYTALRGFVNKNITMQKNNSSDIKVAILQNALKSLKYDEKITNDESNKTTLVGIKNNTLFIKNNYKYNNLKLYSVGGLTPNKPIKDIDIRGKQNFNEPLTNIKDKLLFKIELSSKDGVKTFNLTNNQSKYTEPRSESDKIKINWGVYDEVTQNMVKKFQELNGLNPDGISGKDTIYKILLELKKYNIKIQNHSEGSFSEEDINNYFKKLIKEEQLKKFQYYKNKELKLKSMSEEQLMNEIKNKDSLTYIKNEFDRFNNIEDMTDEQAKRASYILNKK